MKNESFALAVTGGLLRSNHRASLPEHYDLDHLRVPQKATFSFQLTDGSELPFADFYQRVQREGLVALDLAAVEVPRQESLPPHVAAGFLNGVPKALRVATKQHTYLLGMVEQYAPRTLATGKHIFALVDAQEGSAGIWDYVVKRLNENLQLNDITLIPRTGVKDYLSRSESNFIESWGSMFLEAAQEQAYAQGTKFVLPESLKDVFTLQSPLDLFGGGEDPFHAFFYATGHPTAEDFVALLLAQTDGEALLSEVGGAVAFGQGALTGDEAGIWASKISQILTSRKTPVFVPENLRNVFGPDPEELKRIEARSMRSQVPTVAFRPNEVQWVNYRFLEIPAAMAKPLPTMAPAQFAALAGEAEAFSKSIDSGFAHAFAAGQWILTTHAVQAARLDEKGLADLAANYARTGLHPDFQEQVLASLGFLSLFQPMGYDENALRALAAVTLCDVFGGMGSWNDQGFPPGATQQTFEELSARLFAGVEGLFAFALQWKA